MKRLKELNQRQLQAKETKNKITKAAMSLLKTKQYDSIKISDICKLAGISIGGFYHYFDSKEKLVIDAYDIVDDKIIKKYKTRKIDNEIDGILWLSECIASVTESLGERLVRNCYRQLLVDETNYTLSPDRSVHKELKSLINGAIRNKLIKEINPTLLSEYLNKIARGNIFDWCLKHGSFSIVDTLKREVNDIITLFKL